ncbi:hypothetical protein TNIN_13131 [Trichonephila inaurata madagascariensis]|uniref:Uncharacterized protein n=1 Tax=Trichonephila inaurata madagascariensis TaxID=2747483 RepID=A0A8X6IKF7_9ARAC|nr:hypothetical protein TNIN_13131 [Trichonephila inaurata madagascariensis]
MAHGVRDVDASFRPGTRLLRRELETCWTFDAESPEQNKQELVWSWIPIVRHERGSVLFNSSTNSLNFISAITSFVNEDCGLHFAALPGSSYIDVTAVGTVYTGGVFLVTAFCLLVILSQTTKAIEFDIALNSNSPSNDGDGCIFNLKKRSTELFCDSSKYLLSQVLIDRVFLPNQNLYMIFETNFCCSKL